MLAPMAPLPKTMMALAMGSDGLAPMAPPSCLLAMAGLKSSWNAQVGCFGLETAWTGEG